MNTNEWILRQMMKHFDSPIARKTDPDTSKASAAEHTESGARRTNAQRVLVAIGEHPGCTAQEIAHHAGMQAYEVSKRISDLHRKKLIRPGVSRGRCSITDRPARIWFKGH